MHDIPWLCLSFVIIPNLGGWIGIVALALNNEWYNNGHIISSVSPPNWALPMIWTVMYSLMGLAAYISWNKGKMRSWTPMILYALQLALNWLWVWMFYHFHVVLLSLIEIIVLDLVIFACIITFGFEKFYAGALLVPYFVWECFVTYLNWHFFINNHKIKK